MEDSANPIIILSASYDFLSMAPSIESGVNQASGMMALLEVARTFTRLSKDISFADHAKYDLMFVLTPGSAMDYELTWEFMDKLPEKIRERV